mgnify:CR=1 FL=1
MAESELMGVQGIKQKIVESVRTTFFNLLPEEEFNKLVLKEVKAFFEATIEEFTIKEISNPGYYSPPRNDRVKLITPISPFRAIVWAECKALVDDKIGNYFNEEGFSVMMSWENNQQKAILSPALEEMLRSQANELATKFFSSMFAQAFSTVSPIITEEVKNKIKMGY